MNAGVQAKSIQLCPFRQIHKEKELINLTGTLLNWLAQVLNYGYLTASQMTCCKGKIVNTDTSNCVGVVHCVKWDQ